LSTKSYGQFAETMLRDELTRRGYLCIRSAASKALDLICVRPGGSPVGLECKRTHGRAIYVSTSARMREQQAFLQRCDLYGLRTYYAVLFGDGTLELFRPTVGIMREGQGEQLGDVFPPLHTAP